MTVFRPGDLVQLTGPKGRRHTVVLVPGQQVHSHRGTLPHDAILGQPDGSVVTSAAGVVYLALRPRLADFVMSMPRGAAIVYPKDAAQILTLADIAPGLTIVEAGVGSGALTLALLRALGPDGRLISFERRAEFAEVARSNVATFHGATPPCWSLEIGDLADRLVPTLGEQAVDRIVLDMLAPWDCLESVIRALRPGGILCCYVATVTQLSRVVEAIRDTAAFTDADAAETLVRGWHVEGLAVRPDHRMVAHTGFLVTARRLAPGTVLPVFHRRPPKTEYTNADVELWTPGAVGERGMSEKQLRRRVSTAAQAARRAATNPESAVPDKSSNSNGDSCEVEPLS